MAIDWDAALLSSVMSVFGEGMPADQSTWPLYTPRGLPPFRLADAVYDAEYLEANVTPADDTTNTARRPVLGVRESLVVAGCGRGPKQNDKVYIPSVDTTFVVKDVQPDGHGHTKLMLMEAA